MLKQHLEALHRVARPGMVAGDDQVGRLGGRGFEALPRFGREGVLNGIGMPAADPENLSLRANQMADRHAWTDQSRRRSDRPAHRVFRGIPSQQPRRLTRPEPLTMKRSER